MAIGRVAHISTWQVPCGIAAYCEKLTKALGDHDVENFVVPVHPTQWSVSLPGDVARWERELLAKIDSADLVHIQHEHGLFGYALGKKFSLKCYSRILKGIASKGIPCVTTFHTEPVPSHQRGLRRTLSNWNHKRLWKRYVVPYFSGNRSSSMAAIVQSQHTRCVFGAYGLNPSRIHVFNHPCEPHSSDLQSVSNTEAKLQIGLTEGTRLITLFGFVGRYKGHDIVIEALKFLPSNYHFAIVGGSHPEAKDDYLNRLLESIPRKLASRVHLTGWVNKSTAQLYLAATDVCVAPYRRDALLSGSGAITWGLSSGKPIIASKIEAFMNLNRESECLFMVTPDQTRELAWAIQKLDSDESLKSRLIENSRKYCLQHSWEKETAAMLEIYRTLGFGAASVNASKNQRRRPSAD